MDDRYLEASFSSRLQVGLDVTWVQVGYAHQKARPSEGPQLPETEALLQETEIQDFNTINVKLHTLCCVLSQRSKKQRLYLLMLVFLWSRSQILVELM